MLNFQRIAGLSIEEMTTLILFSCVLDLKFEIPFIHWSEAIKRVYFLNFDQFSCILHCVETNVIDLGELQNTLRPSLPGFPPV